MAATPKRATAAETALTGAPLELASFEAAAAALAADFTPITDMRASADYRLQVAANTLLKYGLDVTGAPLPRLTGAGLSADDLRTAAPGAG
jgi:xanthine dehydrogenase small subunit